MKLSIENAVRMYHAAGEAIRMVDRELATVKTHGVSLGLDKDFYIEQLQKMRDNVITNGNESLATLKRTPGYNTENMKELK